RETRLTHINARARRPRVAARASVGWSVTSGRATSLDHLIRPPQQRRWDREPERLGGLHVDHQLELRRLLHRKVPGLGALEDLVHEVCGASREIRHARPVGHEAAGFRNRPLPGDCRETMLCGSCAMRARYANSTVPRRMTIPPAWSRTIAAKARSSS